MIWNKLKKATPEEGAEFKKALQKESLSFKDKFSMLISAYLVLVLPAIIALAVISLLILLSLKACAG